MKSAVDKAHYHKLENHFVRTTVQWHTDAGKKSPMPGKPSWLLHIPEIVEQLEAFDVPVVDRAVVERLFGLRRRQAIELLHRFGGYQAGKTFLIERHHLIEQLAQLARSEEFQSEIVRKERLDQAIDRLRRDRVALQVKIPVQPDVWGRRMATLAAGIRLEAGRLQVDFDSSEDLLAKLFELAQTAANDFNRFCAAAEPVEASKASGGER